MRGAGRRGVTFSVGPAVSAVSTTWAVATPGTAAMAASAASRTGL